MRPVRVSQQLTANEDHVRLPVGENPVGLFGVDYHTHRSGGYDIFGFNRFREWHLVTWSSWNSSVRHLAPAGGVNQIHAMILEDSTEPHGVFNSPSGPAVRVIFR
jgi:hypothetical protein